MYQRSIGPQLVFPTHVGVFLTVNQSVCVSSGLPHACGGVSVAGTATAVLGLSSPRMWGCFRPGSQQRRIDHVFPTHVGVFLFSKKFYLF